MLWPRFASGEGTALAWWILSAGPCRSRTRWQARAGHWSSIYVCKFPSARSDAPAATDN